MKIGTLPSVIQEARVGEHLDHIGSSVDRFAIAAHNKNEVTSSKELNWYKKHRGNNWYKPDSALKSFGYRQGLNTKDKSPGYYAVKGFYKLTRPITHAFDLAGKGIDYVGDKIYSTKIGKKIGDTISDIYHDDEGKHAGLHAVGSGLANYGLGRLNAKANHLENNKAYHAIDAGIGALDAANSYYYGKKRQKRSAAQVAKIRADREELSRLKRKDRDERINRFWDDMKS